MNRTQVEIIENYKVEFGYSIFRGEKGYIDGYVKFNHDGVHAVVLFDNRIVDVPIDKLRIVSNEN
jgi:hypothetical protein